MSEAIQILLEGRMVNGHPMIRNQVKKKDPVSKVEVPQFNTDGTPITDVYFAIAIPKRGEADWKLTAWGQQINAKAIADWPTGEHATGDFSWKITDGDSMTPNKKLKKPCDREGWPGHWIVHCKTQFSVSCNHVGKLAPEQQIANEKEIKTGDYCAVLVGVKGNGPSESPGVYINPMRYLLTRAGAAIINESGPSAEEAFADFTPNIPANAQLDTSVADPGAASAGPKPGGPGKGPNAPANDFVEGAGAGGPTPPVKYMVEGAAYTAAELKSFDAAWTDDVIAALPRA